MSNKPLTKGDKPRLLRACAVIREHLGLGGISAEYRFEKKDDEFGGTALAASMVYRSGWRLLIHIYDAFFKDSLPRQIDTLVHEHLHVAMQPYDQILMRMEGMLLKKDRPQFEENLHVAREITVDRLSAPIARLIEPHLRKVL